MVYLYISHLLHKRCLLIARVMSRENTTCASKVMSRCYLGGMLQNVLFKLSFFENKDSILGNALNNYSLVYNHYSVRILRIIQDLQVRVNTSEP